MKRSAFNPWGSLAAWRLPKATKLHCKAMKAKSFGHGCAWVFSWITWMFTVRKRQWCTYTAPCWMIQSYIHIHTHIYIYIYMYVYGYGSKNGYGSFHVDPDVWNEWATYKSQEVWSGPTEKKKRYTEAAWLKYGSRVRIMSIRNVWIMSMDRLWVQGMYRGLTFWAAAVWYVYII